MIKLKGNGNYFDRLLLKTSISFKGLLCKNNPYLNFLLISEVIFNQLIVRIYNGLQMSTIDGAILLLFFHNVVLRRNVINSKF